MAIYRNTSGRLGLNLKEKPQQEQVIDEQFARDVLEGLSAAPKYLLSKYFYDERGDILFQEIMKMPEYYVTKAEYEIFNIHQTQLLALCNSNNTFDLVEFGAGDGYKTKILLKYFTENLADFTYVPIDISSHVLELLTSDLQLKFPELKVKPIQNHYSKALAGLKKLDTIRKVVLFLGSSIGNYTEEKTITFLTELYKLLDTNDLLIIGFDLKKDPEMILKAYNDPAGITKKFNLNLLQRINDELGGNFNVDKFQHFPTYDPVTGTTTSYLVSREQQTVSIKKLEKDFHFEQWEPVHMEISQKYDLQYIEKLARASGFRIKENLFDRKRLFVDSVWQKDDSYRGNQYPC